MPSGINTFHFFGFYLGVFGKKKKKKKKKKKSQIMALDVDLLQKVITENCLFQIGKKL